MGAASAELELTDLRRHDDGDGRRRVRRHANTRAHVAALVVGLDRIELRLDKPVPHVTDARHRSRAVDRSFRARFTGWAGA
ncbi:MAG TPA: hypothetical protein VFC31_00775 [Candidatus Limnocylindria bacterium]|nr:hypothetical protein [Candidatus Limnocylindria bacterium]